MTRLLLVFTALTLLAACGKRGSPQPPGPKASITFPRSYPTY